MFTGLVEATGTVEAFTRGPEGWRLRVAAGPMAGDTVLGESIAVNGCCVTATGAGAGAIDFDVLEETRRLTSFSGLRPGAAVNLERSLRFDGRVGGHFLTGHIDGLGRILEFERRGQDHYLRVQAPEGSGRYLAVKGSIAIDGISLTLAEVEGDAFAVWLIPHTLKVTNLRERRPDDDVNLEFDLLAKYVEKMMAYA